MTTVKSNLPANLFTAAPTLPVQVSKEVPFSLTPGQMFQATVVEGGLDRAVLEINHQNFLAQGERELRVGQKINLQVMQTQPHMEFRVLSDSLGNRLSQALPLLARPFDWGQLVSQLRQLPQQELMPLATAENHSQLQRILNSAAEMPAHFKENITHIVAKFQQLAVSGKLAAGNINFLPDPIPQAQGLQNNQHLATFALSRPVTLLIKGLQNQLSLLPEQTGTEVPKNWYAETRNLLLPLQQGRQLPPLTLPQHQLLVTVLNQIQQSSKVIPQLAGEVKQVLIQIGRQMAEGIPPAAMKADVRNGGAVSPQTSSRNTLQSDRPQADSLSPTAMKAGVLTAKNGGVVVSSQASGHNALQSGRPVAEGVSSAAVKGEGLVPKGVGVVSPHPFVSDSVQSQTATDLKRADISSQLSTEIKGLLTQVQQGQAKSEGIAPELLGRLEGLLSRLQQGSHGSENTPALLPDFEIIVNRLEQLATQQPIRPHGGSLGLLSQLFGFHLEAELLRGKKRDALTSLKLSLLNLQKELGEEVKEPLRRVELFQLCKAKFAEEQVQFLPLPFSELEEGYLLAEKQPQMNDDNIESDPPLQMSLSLRLSALGNMRIDMLYEKEGLHLRLACEDHGKMRYLQNCVDELKGSLEAIELQGVSFSADAQLPLRQLQERLLPGSCGMLNERL